MSDRLIIDQEMKILNMKTIWDGVLPSFKEARENKTLCHIDLSAVKNIDGAGLQSVLYFKFLEKEFPEHIKISDTSTAILKKIQNLELSMEESEEKE